MKVRLKELECKQCGHQWIPRVGEVRMCPKCKSTYWDRDRNTIRVGSNDPSHPHPYKNK